MAQSFLSVTQETKTALSSAQLESVRLLTLSTQELESHIKDMVNSNPLLLSEDKTSADLSSPPEVLPCDTPVGICPNYEREAAFFSWKKTDLPTETSNEFDSIAAPCTLTDFLEQQLIEVHLENDIRSAIHWIIGCLDDNGFLSDTLKSIASSCPQHFSPSVWKAALDKLQSFDPAGVASSGPREALYIQIARKDVSPSLKTVAHQVLDELFLENDKSSIESLSSKLKFSNSVIESALALIQTLTPHPTATIPNLVTSVPHIVPEVILYMEHGNPHVEINENAIPALRFDYETYDLLKRNKLSAQQKNSWQNLAREAKQLLNALEYRYSTIVVVAEKIVSHQCDFFLGVSSYLKPLSQKEIAQALNIHESTVSRAVTEKYIQTPRGLLELKSLFCNAVNVSSNSSPSAEKVIELIRTIVKNELPAAPLSDSEISHALATQGISISRRTVAKYREIANIASKTKRKALLPHK